MIKITREINDKYLKQMNEVKIRYAGDQELAHIIADGILCDLLISLGYPEVVEVYNSIDKWYS